MLKPLSARMSALILANFVAASSTGIAAMVFIAVYVALTPPGLSNGVAAMVGGAIFLGLLAAIAASIIAFPFFLAGLILVGIPTWWVLHRMGWTNRVAFIVVAASESILGGVAVAPLLVPIEAFATVLLLALPGGLAGWVIWRRGYERAPRPLPPPPAPPS